MTPSPLPDRHPRLILVVIDGLGDRVLRRAMEEGHAPTLRRFVEAGATHHRAISPFPSLTPTCLASIVTGGLTDEHRIPSLSWVHRGERRFVEYGSSLKATSVEGFSQFLDDVLINLNHVHLADSPPTLFEAVEDAGYVAACINYLVFRGRTRHSMKYAPMTRVARRAQVSEAVYAPSHFYWGELYGEPRPVALPQVGLRRIRDWSAAHVARWLVRRTEADFILLYLGQHDLAAHKAGPDDTMDAVRIADRSLERVVDALGGIERCGEDWALVLCADHGQVQVESGHYVNLDELFDDVRVFRGSRLDEWDDCDLAIAATNRFAMVYRIDDEAPSEEWIASRLLQSPAADIAIWRDDRDGSIVVHNAIDSLRITESPDGAAAWSRNQAERRWKLDGTHTVLDLRVEDGRVHYGAYPDAIERLDSALSCVNAGDVLVSARVGWEFTDGGGVFHTGGSHGSLHEVDSIAPVLSMGLRGDASPPTDRPIRLADVYRMVTAHFGIGDTAP